MIDKDSTTQLYPSPLRYSWSSHRDGESGMEDVKFDMICSTKMIRLKIAWFESQAGYTLSCLSNLIPLSFYLCKMKLMLTFNSQYLGG